MVPVTLQFRFGVQRHKPYSEREARVKPSYSYSDQSLCFSNNIDDAVEKLFESWCFISLEENYF